MIYIGIDPGATSAVAVIQQDDGSIPLIVAVHKVVMPAAKMPWGSRGYAYLMNIKDLFTQYKPAVVYCEEPYIKFRTASKAMDKQLATIQIAAAMYDPLLPVIFINPSVVKKTITGDGKAEKDVLASRVAELVANPALVHTLIEAKKFDETDSIAIALAGYRTGGL